MSSVWSSGKLMVTAGLPFKKKTHKVKYSEGGSSYSRSNNISSRTIVNVMLLLYRGRLGFVCARILKILKPTYYYTISEIADLEKVHIYLLRTSSDSFGGHVLAMSNRTHNQKHTRALLLMNRMGRCTS